MNLFITGGTGFFGRALIRYLESERLAHGRLPFEQITILSRSPGKFCLNYPALANLSWIRWKTGDVLSPDSLPQEGRYHYILHAAADSTDANSLTPQQKYRQIVEGTENILKVAAALGTRRFLLISSGGVYGPQPTDMVTIPETYNGMPDPLNPYNVYGVAKRQAEHLCALYGHQFDIETVIARCFAFVGEDLPMNAHFAIGNFIRDALTSHEILVNGNGSPIRSYMDQSDLAHWMLVLLRCGKASQAYNVGSPEAISIADLAFLVRDTVAPEKPVCILGHCPKDSLRNRYLPDVNKAQRELGLRITVPLREAIARMVAGLVAENP